MSLTQLDTAIAQPARPAGESAPPASLPGGEAGAPISPHARPITRVESHQSWLDVRLGEVWAYRELLYFFVLRDVKVRYRQTIIGVAWVVIQPLMAMGAYSLFFGKVAKLPSQGLPYPVFYFLALVPWNYFAQALTNCTSTVVANQHVITKVYFPRLVLPLAAVSSGLVDFSVGFAVMLVLVTAYGIRLTLAALLLPGLLLLAMLTALAVGLWTSALNALYRDVGSVMGFATQFWMIASPVAYPSSMLPKKWQLLYHLNPMAGVIDGFRWALTGHGQPPGGTLLVSAAMVLALLIGGLIFFQRVEGTVTDRV